MTTIDTRPTETGNGTRPATPLDMEGLAWILFGHAAFQYLNAATELGLFETLYRRGPLTGAEIGTELGLARRANDILLLGCTSLGLITRRDGSYELSPVLTKMLGTDDWRRFRDTVAFEQYIVYEGQLDFTESLRTNSNAGLRRFPGEGPDLYHRLGENPELGQVFYRYMRSWSELANEHLVKYVDLTGVRRLLDCGGGDAVNAIALAKANPELDVTILEIAECEPVANEKIAEAGLTDRIRVQSGDMFKDAFPDDCDCVMFAHQLVIWTLEENTALLSKAYEALPPGGKLVILNSMSNDEGDGPVVAALDSVYFAAMPAEGGMIYSWAQHEECLRAAGFVTMERIPCDGWTPHGIIVATK